MEKDINELIDKALEAVEYALNDKIQKKDDQKLVLKLLKGSLQKFKNDEVLETLIEDLKKYKDSFMIYSSGENSVWHKEVIVCGEPLYLCNVLDKLYDVSQKKYEKKIETK